MTPASDDAGVVERRRAPTARAMRKNSHAPSADVIGEQRRERRASVQQDRDRDRRGDHSEEDRGA